MPKHANPHMEGVCAFAAVIYKVITDRYGKLKRILELGCGPGGNLAAFRDASVRTGVEPFPLNIKTAHERHPEVQLICGDHTALQAMPDKSYDVAFTCSVLDHIEDFEPVLADLIRIATRMVLFEPYIPGKERQATSRETSYYRCTWYHDYKAALNRQGIVPVVFEPHPFVYPKGKGRNSSKLFHLIIVE